MDFNNGYITILSVMSAVFALHLVLKRDQIAKVKSQRLVREKMSLLELKEEIAHNLVFFDRINDGSPFELNHNDNLKNHAVQKYTGDFPLTSDEMVCIEGKWSSVEKKNEDGTLTSGKSNISKDLDFVIAGMHTKKNNIELKKL